MYYTLVCDYCQESANHVLVDVASLQVLEALVDAAADVLASQADAVWVGLIDRRADFGCDHQPIAFLSE